VSLSVSGSTLAEVLAALDTGPISAGIQIYSGTRPPEGGLPGTSVLLTRISLQKPAGTISGGLLTLLQLEKGLVLASGTATWARVVTSNDEYVFDGNVGLIASSAPFKLDTLGLLTGSTVAMTTGAITLTAVTPPTLSGTDLVFTTPRVTTQPVNLVFNDTTASVPDLQATAILLWSANVERPLTSSTTSRYQPGKVSRSATTSRYQPSPLTSAPRTQRYQEGQRRSSQSLDRYQVAYSIKNDKRTRYQEGQEIRSHLGNKYQEALNIKPLMLRVRFNSATAKSSATINRYQEADAGKRVYSTSRFQEGRLLSLPLAERYQEALKLVLELANRYQEGIPPPPGIHPPIDVSPIDERCYIPPRGDQVHLVFEQLRAATDVDLVFSCERAEEIITVPPIPGLVVVPEQGVYLVTNNTSLRKVTGNISLPCFSATIGIDYQSWAWNLSANLPANLLSILQPATPGDPVEIEATVNGIVFRFLIDKISRSRSFGDAAISITARSLTAELDAPISAEMSFTNASARTAQQLMGDVLTQNSVPIGWTVNFTLGDWSIPAGVWNHQGARISALNAIAAAAGGYIQPDPALRTINVLPKYPLLPRDWNTITPDYQLPTSVVVTEGIEWRNVAPYNRVFVSGISTGVLAQATIDGTAGDLAAPMVTDALITTSFAARQRATSVLGATGPMADVTLSLPVLPLTGIIMPGKFVLYMDGTTPRLGIARSTSIQINSPEVIQSITLETHL
jgi:hypothetical protein